MGRETTASSSSLVGGVEEVLHCSALLWRVERGEEWVEQERSTAAFPGWATPRYIGAPFPWTYSRPKEFLPQA